MNQALNFCLKFGFIKSYISFWLNHYSINTTIKCFLLKYLKFNNVFFDDYCDAFLFFFTHSWFEIWISSLLRWNFLPLLCLWHLAEHHAAVWICLHRSLSWRTAGKEQSKTNDKAIKWRSVKKTNILYYEYVVF